MIDLSVHALELSRRALSVFPLQPRGKRPLQPWEAWQHEKPSVAQVEAWWAATPNANIGVATGRVSRVWVLDVDGDRGAATLEALIKSFGVLPETWRSITGRGTHIWFSMPEGRDFGNSAGRVGAGLDVRANGGYVVAPGSIHENGNHYHWDIGCRPGEIGTPPQAPSWLLDLTDPPKPPVVEIPVAAPRVPHVGSAYVQKAVEGELSRITSTAEGQRNDTLNRAAFALGQFVGAQALDREAAEEHLLQAALAVGLEHRESVATITSGLNAGTLEPRELPPLREHARPHSRSANGHDTSSNGPPPETGGSEAPPDDLPALYSEVYLALRFATQHAEEARYVAAWGHWHLWDGHAWEQDETMLVWSWAKAIVQEASAELEAEGKSGKALASAKTVAAIVSLARADRRHAATLDQWDRDPYTLNTPAGMIDLRDGTISKNDPEAYCTKITSVSAADHVPADCRWLRFLDRVCGGDQSLIDYLQRAVGYSLTGSTKEEVFFFLYGLGQNGKSQFIKAVSSVLGSYHTNANMETFTANRFEQHPTELAKLRGARMVSAAETEEDRRWAEARIKAITGGDAIDARFMRQDIFTFKPLLKLWVHGNHKPGLRNVDKAMQRRLHIVPFTVTIAEHERDQDLGAKLEAEGPIILRWAINGCLAWQTQGLNPPKVVAEATESYITQQDVVSNWLDECCETGPNERDTSKALWESFSKWTAQAGEHTGTQKRFSQMLQNRGFTAFKGGAGVRYFNGLTLKVVVQDERWDQQ